jgi:hypothetical protein
MLSCPLIPAAPSPKWHLANRQRKHYPTAVGFFPDFFLLFDPLIIRCLPKRVEQELRSGQGIWGVIEQESH